MKLHQITRGKAAFTLVEIAISMGIFMVVSLIAYSLLMSSTTLLAKNIALNQSNMILRGGLDRVYAEVNQANGLPKLINVDGSPAPSNGPAAGIIFDRFLGGPYVVTNPGAGLPASTQSFTLTRSTHSLAAPPVPKLNDVVQIDTGKSRPVVSTCVAGTVAPAPDLSQSLTVTLKAPLGSSIAWSTNTKQIANLVHREAFVVVPTNGRAELRYYRDAEVVTNYDAPGGYTVLNREIGMKVQGTDDEAKPFTIVQQNGVGFLQIAMRVEDQNYNKVLANKYAATDKAREFNSFLRVDTMLKPRNSF